MIIKGDFNEAGVFTENIDKETISQVKVLLNQEFVKNSSENNARLPQRGRMCYRDYYDYKG